MSNSTGAKVKPEKKPGISEWFSFLTCHLLTNIPVPEVTDEEMKQLNKIFVAKREHLRWLNDKVQGSRGPLGNLIDKFTDDSDYGIGRYWIAHLFEVCEKTVKVTQDRLKWDIVHRVMIECLHDKRNEHLSEGGKTAALKIENRIDSIARQRNLPLDQLEDVPPSLLKFDLHWFTLSKAIEFVKDLIFAVENSNKMLLFSDLAIPLLTGHGLHNDRALSDIRELLLDLYNHRITMDRENKGILILHFKKKVTYSDIHFGEFPRLWNYDYCRYCNSKYSLTVQVCNRIGCLSST